MSNTTPIIWSEYQAVIGPLEATAINSQAVLNLKLSERICKFWYVAIFNEGPFDSNDFSKICEDEKGPLTLGSASLGIFTNIAFVAV